MTVSQDFDLQSLSDTPEAKRQDVSKKPEGLIESMEDPNMEGPKLDTSRNPGAANSDEFAQSFESAVGCRDKRAESDEEVDRLDSKEPARRTWSNGETAQKGMGRFLAASDDNEDEDSLGTGSARSRMRALLDNRKIQALSSFLIIVTVVLICMDTDARARGSKASLPEDVIMSVCFVAYVLEFLATSFVEGRRSVSNIWSYIDAFVIITSLCDYVVSALDGGGVEMLRLFRICRLLRLGRLMRTMKLLQRVSWLKEQYILFAMMASCLRTLLWAFLLCFAVMTLWSILAVELLNDAVKVIADNDPHIWDGCYRCTTAFNSIWNSNWTFFQTIVAGDSWGLLALPIIEAHPWTAIIFVGALSTIVFGIMNLIAAVVIDTFAERRQKDIASMASDMEYEELQEKKQLEKIFEKIDEDRSGALSIDELFSGAERVREFRHYLRVLDIDENDLTDLFEMIDNDGSGEVDATEFIEALYRMKHTDPKTATRFVKHMVANIFDKHQNLKERLDVIQDSVLDRLSKVETRLVSDLEETTSKGEAGQDQFKDLLRGHTMQIDEVISKAMQNVAEATLQTAMDSAVAKASQAMRQVFLASSHRTAAMNDRVNQIVSDADHETFSRQITPFASAQVDFKKQVTPPNVDRNGFSKQVTPESTDSSPPQPKASKRLAVQEILRGGLPSGAGSLFSFSLSTSSGSSWKPDVVENVSSDVPIFDARNKERKPSQDNSILLPVAKVGAKRPKSVAMPHSPPMSGQYSPRVVGKKSASSSSACEPSDSTPARQVKSDRQPSESAAQPNLQTLEALASRTNIKLQKSDEDAQDGGQSPPSPKAKAKGKAKAKAKRDTSPTGDSNHHKSERLSQDTECPRFGDITGSESEPSHKQRPQSIAGLQGL